MSIAPCDCLKRLLVDVEDGRAHCVRHKLYGEKIEGAWWVIRAARPEPWSWRTPPPTRP
jgi:hypothetical protein